MSENKEDKVVIQLPATICNLAANMAVKGNDVNLKIHVPTPTPQQQTEVHDAIQKAIEKAGFTVQWTK